MAVALVVPINDDLCLLHLLDILRLSLLSLLCMHLDIFILTLFVRLLALLSCCQCGLRYAW